MASTRLVFGCATLTLAIAVGVTAQVPSTEIGPVEQRARPVTPDNPIPRRFYAVDPVYPPEAASIDATARVPVRVVLDEFGRVAEVRPLMRPMVAYAPRRAPDATALEVARDAVLRSAVDAVRQWQYDAPHHGPIAFDVTFRFAPATATFVADQGVNETVTVRAGIAPPPPPPPPPSPTSPGSPAASATAAWDPPAEALRAGGSVRAPRAIFMPNPVYPSAAEAARVQGVVILDATIGPDGRVTDARVLRSIPLLDQAAIDAVRQWRYTPMLVNGAAVPVVMTVTAQFTLQ